MLKCVVDSWLADNGVQVGRIEWPNTFAPNINIGHTITSLDGKYRGTVHTIDHASADGTQKGDDIITLTMGRVTKLTSKKEDEDGEADSI